MGWIAESLDKWITSFFVDITSKFLSLLATIMNVITGNAIDSLKLLPQEWNIDLYNLSKDVHSKVIVPIAIIILAFLMTKDLIDSMLDHNNMKTMQDDYLFKWILRVVISMFFISKSFELVNGVLALSRIFINSSTLSKENLNFVIENIEEWKKQMTNNLSSGTSFVLMLGSTICCGLCVAKILKMLIAVFKRMFDMLYLLAFSSIPLSMIASSKYEHETWNYFRKIFAVCIQVAIFLFLIRMLDIVWNKFILVDFKTTEITYVGIIVVLLKMFAYISCISLGFDKVEEYSEKILGVRG